jgi:PAT family beta-lactamase induction signal transducer AmpG
VDCRARRSPALAGAAAAATGAATYQNGAWQTAYLVMAASMAVGMVTVLLSREPGRGAAPARNAAEWLRGALVEPFADFCAATAGRRR